MSNDGDGNVTSADNGRSDVEISKPIASSDGDGSGTYSPGESAAFHRLQEAKEKIVEQLSQVIVGQDDVIEELLISLFSRGHCLLEGVPGLAKTLMISTLARTLNLSFSRIQFTPDLMPADITGTEIIEENRTPERGNDVF